MAENAKYEIDHTGMFLLTTKMAGAPTLQACLTVPFDSSIAIGHGILTQATNPPLHMPNVFTGNVHALGLGKAEQVFALHGAAPNPQLLGAPHVTQLFIALDGIWGTKGTANYSYMIGAHLHEVKDVPVNVEWLAK